MLLEGTTMDHLGSTFGRRHPTIDDDERQQALEAILDQLTEAGLVERSQP